MTENPSLNPVDAPCREFDDPVTDPVNAEHRDERWDRRGRVRVRGLHRPELNPLRTSGRRRIPDLEHESFFYSELAAARWFVFGWDFRTETYEDDAGTSAKEYQGSQ